MSEGASSCEPDSPSHHPNPARPVSTEAGRGDKQAYSSGTSCLGCTAPLAFVLITAFAVLLIYSWSISLGWFQDDHLHWQQLHDSDWSFRSVIAASRLGFVGPIMDLWGRPAIELSFFRPVAFWVMKLVYTIGRWEAWPMHVFSIALHLACSLLVGLLARRLLDQWSLATTAALIMAVHPAHVATVNWIACQTELMTCLLLLLGVLAYARYAGWGQVGARTMPSGPEPAVGKVWAGLAIVCYGLALGCRENALFFPLICWLGDRLCGSVHVRRFRWEHFFMLGLLALYLLVRTWAGAAITIPRRPYCVPPADPEFLMHLCRKAVYYGLGLTAGVPVVPMGEFAYFADRPEWFYGGFALAVAVIAGIWAGHRFCRVILWPIAWTAICVAPLVPLFSSSHHLYLPSVGVALLVAAGLAAISGPARRLAWNVWSFRRFVAVCVVTLYVAALGSLTWVVRWAYVRGVLIEQQVVDEVLRRSGPLRDGDHLFFINLSLLSYCVVPAIENRTGLRSLTGHVLTFSPWLIRMEQPGEAEVLDAGRIRVRSAPERPYFSGVTGRLFREAMGYDRIPPVNEPIPAPLYTVIPRRADAEGVTELEFVFNQPINSPGYHIYFGSPVFLAYPLQAAHHETRESACAASTSQSFIKSDHRATQ